MFHKLTFLLGWSYYFLIVRGISMLPLRAAHLVMGGVTWFRLKPFNRAFRLTVHKNLARVFGSWEGGTRLDRLVHDHCAIMARENLDTFYYGRLRPTLDQPLLSIKGLRHLDAALDRGNGVIFLIGHFGRFEPVAVVLGKMGYRLNMLTQPISEAKSGLAPGTVHYLRYKSRRLLESMGGKQVEVGSYLRPLYRILRRNEILLFGFDSHLGSAENRRPAKFLGGAIYLQESFARLASYTRAAIVPLFVYYDGPFHKVGMIHEPLLAEAPAGDPHDIERLFLAGVACLEGYVKLFPSQYWSWSFFDHLWVQTSRAGASKNVAANE